ncbi:Subtilisin inhibitor 1 [Apostasia shenzhenica]|uniref:Subtilisin inhibitor 1 n=1 Tax=Apostasia shenzhenica TaxID=1088818 RepID=A0A2I0A8W0_9ASPA|nr:Subtilisin inhibitor 1 [Apostasia shenzhenica]
MILFLWFAAEQRARDNWPEVVGLPAEEAEKKIREEQPESRIQIVGPDQMVTMDFSTGRVRIFVDSAGKVASTPRIG